MSHHEGINDKYSETSSQINKQRPKIESMQRMFEEIDKDFDSQLTQTEIINFLNTHTKNESEFNRNLANRFITSLDFDQNGLITVEEFVKGYISFENDLENTANDFKSKLKTEENTLRQYQDKCRACQQEELQNGICDNAFITVKFTEIDMKTKLDEIMSIAMTVKLNEHFKTTQFMSGSTNDSIHLNEEFKFIPKSRQDKMEFLLRGKHSDGSDFEIGKKVFDLNTIQSQDKYEITIELPDIYDNKSIIAHIKTIIFFYWSDYEKYSELAQKSENQIQKIKKAIHQTNNYLKTLNDLYGLSPDPIKQLRNEMTDYGNTHNNYSTYNYSNENLFVPSTINENLNGNTSSPNAIVEYAEGMLKGIFKQKTISWVVISRILGGLLGLIAMLFSFVKGDFPNALGGFLTLLGLMMIKQFRNQKELIKVLLYMIIGLFVYDIIWLRIYGGNCWDKHDRRTGGNENGLLIASFFITIINEVLKGMLGFSLWVASTKA
jgi:hypothetical protein